MKPRHRLPLGDGASSIQELTIMDDVQEDDDVPPVIAWVFKVSLLWVLLRRLDEDPEYIDRLASQLRNNQGTDSNHDDA